MNLAQAIEAAERISRQYGQTILFREPGRAESYQARACEASDLPEGAVIISHFVGKATTKTQALQALKDALRAATDTSLLDDLAGDVHPDIINQFCDAVDDFVFEPRTAAGSLD